MLFFTSRAQTTSFVAIEDKQWEVILYVTLPISAHQMRIFASGTQI